jgi:hypothetical protein
MLTPDVHRDEGWLLFGARVPETFPANGESLLRWSAELPGGCKFVRAAPRAPIWVRAEVPLAVESEERIASVRVGFAAAAFRLGASTAPRECEASARPAAGVPPDLAGLCREAGWPFEKRSEGSLVVDLGVQNTYLPALVEARADRIAAEIELVRLPEAEGPCRTALAGLLLRANGVFRMTRAVVREPEPRALLEVCLPRCAGVEEIGEALAALAVAARRSALEARLLAADERLARAYLDCSGMGPLAGKS